MEYSEDVEDLDDVSRELFLNAIMSAVSELWERGFLEIVKLQDVGVDCGLIEELRSVERNLSYDDALHLCVSIKKGCERFVTTDSIFDVSGEKGSGELVAHLSKEYNLKVKYVRK